MNLPPVTAPTLSPGADAAAERRLSDLRKAAEGFEEMFLATLLKGGRAGSLGDDLTGSSAVNQTRDMLDAELARSSAHGADLGIAEAVVRQFSGHVKAGS